MPARSQTDEIFDSLLLIFNNLLLTVNVQLDVLMELRRASVSREANNNLMLLNLAKDDIEKAITLLESRNKPTEKIH